MESQTKKTILILVFLVILYGSFFMIYHNWEKRQPPPKEILDDGVLLVYPRMTEIAYASSSFYSFFQGRV